MKRCLIVDDSRVVRKVARRIVEDLRFEADEAADGQQALVTIARAQTPPTIDGFLDDKAWKNAVVIGCGPIGLLVGLCLRYAGTENTLLCDISPQREKRAAGLNFQTINSSEENLADRVAAMSGGEGADILFECAGSAPVALQMCDLVRPRGKIVMVSVHKEPHPVDLRAITFKEISLVGTRVYTRDDFRRAIQILPELPYQDVISHRFELEQGAEGFEIMGQAADACKVIIRTEY